MFNFNTPSYASAYGTELTNMFDVSAGNSMVGNGSSWGNIFSGVGQGLSGLMSGLTGIGQVWNAYQANKLAKEQFAFEKSAYQTNLANQAKMINNSYASAANISAQLGSTPGNTLATSQAVTDYKKKAEDTQYVSSTMQ